MAFTSHSVLSLDLSGFDKATRDTQFSGGATYAWLFLYQMLHHGLIEIRHNSLNQVGQMFNTLIACTIY
jgi:hypothetical protein